MELVTLLPLNTSMIAYNCNKYLCLITFIEKFYKKNFKENQKIKIGFYFSFEVNLGNFAQTS